MNRTQHPKMTTQDMTLTALMAAIFCILGPLSLPIPVSPVPITLTNLAIYLISGLFGWKIGTLSYLIYLFLGLAGLPVFSGFGAGIGKLLGPTGGYLIGFIFTSAFCGFLSEHRPGKPVYFLGLVAGTLLAYFLGTFWLGYQADLTLLSALWVGVIPYIPGDLIKIGIAVFLVPPVQKRLFHSHILS